MPANQWGINGNQLQIYIVIIYKMKRFNIHIQFSVIKIKMLTCITNRIKTLDSNPYTIQLNYKNRHNFKSTTGGLITLLFIIASGVVIITNSISFFTQSNYIFDQIQIKNDLTNVTLNGSYFGLLITAWNQTGSYVLNTNDMYNQFGLSVVVEKVTSIFDPNPQIDPLVQGSNLSEFDFTNFTSIQGEFNLSGSSSVISPTEQIPYVRQAIIIKNISKTNNYNYTVSFVFVNHALNPKQVVQTSNYKIRQFFINDGAFLAPSETHQLTFQFKKLWTITDTSLSFLKNQVQTNQTFFDQQYDTILMTTSNDATGVLIKIQLKRSLYTVHYNRYFKKLSTFLAETFGVIGLISLIFILTRGYNKWRFTQSELIQPRYRQQTNIIKYYMHVLRNLRNYTVSSKIYDEFQHNLDIHKILQRLEDFEVRLRRLQGKSELIFSSHHQPQYSKINQNTIRRFNSKGKNLLREQDD